MALSSQSFNADGVTSVFPVTIEYQDRQDIRVFVNDVRVFEAEGVWVWNGPTDHSILFISTPTAGTLIEFRRTSDLSEMRHDFSDGAQFIAQNLDDNFQQLMLAAQELQEQGTGGGGGTPGDISANQVAFTPTPYVTSTNVQAAVEEVAERQPSPAINFPLSNGIASIGSSNRYAREDHTDRKSVV